MFINDYKYFSACSSMIKLFHDNEFFFNVRTFEVCFLHSKVKSIIDDWDVFESSYDKASNCSIVPSYELLNICLTSMVDET